MQISYPESLWNGYTSAGSSPAAEDSAESTARRDPSPSSSSGSAVEVNTLRLQLVEIATRILERLPSTPTLSASDQQKLQELLRSVLEQNTADAGRLRELLQWTANLEQTLARPENRDALNALLRAFPQARQNGATTLPPTVARELLDILARNDFSRLPDMVQALRASAGENLNSLPKVWLPLLAAVQELSALGAPVNSAISKESLSAAVNDLRQQLVERTALALPREIFTELQKHVATPLTPGQMFSAEVTQLDARTLELDGKVRLPLPADSQWPRVLSSGQTLLFSLETVQNKAFLQPWPASAQIPLSEQNYWQQSGLPPTAHTADTRHFLAQYGTLPADPALAGQVGKALHQLSLLQPEGQATPEQKELLFRTVLLSRGEALAPPVLESLLRYTNSADADTDLFQKLPAGIRERILAEIPSGAKALEPALLQNAVERVLEQLRGSATQEESRQLLQQLKEQLQWTRLDQDTRHPADREQVFYWMHAGELQKGRLRIRDERQSRNPDGDKNQPVVFSIEAKLPRLGRVQADLKLWKDHLDVRIADEQGAALEAVQAERSALAQELAEMGLELGQLVYGMQESTADVRSSEIFLPGSAGGRLDLKG